MTIFTTLSLYALLGLANAQIVKKPLLENAIRDFTDDFEAILPEPQKYTTAKWSADDGKKTEFFHIYIFYPFLFRQRRHTIFCLIRTALTGYH